MKRFIGAALCMALALGVAAGAMAAPKNSPSVKTLKFVTNWGASPKSLQSDSVFVSAGAIATVRVDTTEAFLAPRFITQGEAAAVGADSSWHFTLAAHETKTGTESAPGSGTTFSGATEAAYVRWQIQFSYDDGANWYSSIADTSDCAPAELGSTDMFPRVFNSRLGTGSIPAPEMALGTGIAPGVLMRVIQYTGVNGALSLKLIGYEGTLE